MKKMDHAAMLRCVDEIIARTFPEGTVIELTRRDPEGDGWFVQLDDPTNDFEYVEIFVNHDGTWES